jgi:phosphoenolpyruvate carboxykinase (ATP)
MFHDKLENNSLEPLVVKVYPSCMKEPVVAINFSKRMVLISGTRYSGEIKKSVFTYLNFILPASDILTMHCSINCDYNKENVAVFFGLSGTGKTTLSSAPDRLLLGDDEHGWSSTGVFNFEGGCYAKTYGLTGHSEPQIWAACHKFGAILENVTFRDNGYINFLDDSHSKNGRASYPLSFVGGALTGGFIDSQPKTVIMLTCDAFGVLPAMSKLSIEDARKQFLLGYTSKVEGTEHGITSPVATFSPCFGLPFMPRKPEVYADLLVDFLSSSGATCWLVNTGWFGGPQGEGERIPLDVTRAIVGCITDGTMDDVPTFFHEQTGLNIPDVSGVPACFINPELAWSNPIMYNMQVEKLKRLIDEQS